MGTPKSSHSPEEKLRDKINRGLEDALAEAEHVGYVSAKESRRQIDDLFNKARKQQAPASR